eukprot:4993312-Amphidinium_carterae.1
MHGSSIQERTTGFLLGVLFGLFSGGCDKSCLTRTCEGPAGLHDTEGFALKTLRVSRHACVSRRASRCWQRSDERPCDDRTCMALNGEGSCGAHRDGESVACGQCVD